MHNYTAIELTRNFYRKPRGGYPAPNPGAINTSGPKTILRPRKGTIRPALNQPKSN